MLAKLYHVIYNPWFDESEDNIELCQFGACSLFILALTSSSALSLAEQFLSIQHNQYKILTINEYDNFYYDPEIFRNSRKAFQASIMA